MGEVLRSANIPGVADTDDVVHVAEGELEDLVCQDAGSIRKAKQRVICEDGTQTHGPTMENGLMTQSTQARMAVDNLDLLSDKDVAQDREGREDSREGRGSEDDEERDMIDSNSIGQVAHAAAALV